MSLLLVLALVSADYRPAFLDIPSFSRATGLGSAYAGIADDPSGVFYNPAGPDRDGLRFALTNWLLDTRLAAGAGAFALRDIVRVAAGVTYLHYGDLVRWDDQGNMMGAFSCYSMVGKLACSHDVAGRLTLGAGLGYVTEKIDDWQTGTLAADLGIRAHWPRFGAGLALRDFTGSSVPFVKSFGLYGRPLGGLLLVAAAEHSDHLSLRAGAEYTIDVATVRAGYDGQKPCFGLGLRFKPVLLDYSVAIHPGLGLVHQLTLGINR
jgi:hypothetical protein